jgi:hypothetical protein
MIVELLVGVALVTALVREGMRRMNDYYGN